jgi:hypothetical protein
MKQNAFFACVLFCAGEPCSVKLIKLLASYITDKCDIWNLYGPAETIICTFHYIHFEANTKTVPIGLSMPNYRCLIHDEFLKSVAIGREGQLFVGGVGVFAGYLGRDDLTEKALIEIDGEIFYRTGDIVRMDNNGLLHYQGRKDHQIKLHGQRIELGEIERCLLNTSISACVVMKWGDDHLVAYVQSSTMNEEQLRQHCQSHLPPHMIPSIFIVLDKLPLNSNGKIDRQRLPIPQFSSYPSTSNDYYHAEPSNQLERHIHSLWCNTLHHAQISIDSSFFDIGGHSLLLVQLYHNYKMLFNVNMTTISIGKLLQYPTIAHHARLISQSIDDQLKYSNISPLTHLAEGILQ